ncbi:MAG: recombination protein RecR, partial [Holosporales bacterium]|nr:recombination protein RecR [Holosporales bacterium]
MRKSNNEIDKLIGHFSRLPGMGARSAARLVIYLLKRKDSVLESLIKSLSTVRENSVICEICGNIDDRSPCSICSDPKRNKSILCVV